MLLPIRQKSTINSAFSPSIDQKLVWTVMFIDCRWTRVSYPYFPTDDRNVSKNAWPYAYWNLTRKKGRSSHDERFAACQLSCFQPGRDTFPLSWLPVEALVLYCLYIFVRRTRNINLGVLKRVARKTKIECSTEFREGFVNLEWANTVGIHER